MAQLKPNNDRLCAYDDRNASAPRAGTPRAPTRRHRTRHPPSVHHRRQERGHPLRVYHQCTGNSLRARWHEGRNRAGGPHSPRPWHWEPELTELTGSIGNELFRYQQASGPLAA
jgi:IS5 family transposase